MNLGDCTCELTEDQDDVIKTDPHCPVHGYKSHAQNNKIAGDSPIIEKMSIEDIPGQTICGPGKCIEFPHKPDCACYCHDY